MTNKKNKKIILISGIVFFVIIVVVATIILLSIGDRSAEMGDNAYNQGDYDLAIKYYTRAINFSFWDRYIKSYNLYSRGVAYGNKGEYDLAIADFTKAIKFGKDQEWAAAYIVFRGIMYQRKGEYDLAMLDYNQALSILYSLTETGLYDEDDLLHGRDLITTQINSIERIQIRELLDNALPGTKEHTAEIHYKQGLDYAYNLKQANISNNNINSRIMEIFSGIYFPGDLDEAITEWEEAVRVYPDHLDAKESLEKARTQKTNNKRNLESLITQNDDPRWQRWNATMVRDITYVEFSGVLEYFLFYVDVNAGETNIMNPKSFHFAFTQYLEEHFVVDYDSIGENKNNIRLSKNVKQLMAKHGANVSVTFDEPDDDGAITVIINMDTSYIQEDTYAFVSFDIYQK